MKSVVKNAVSNYDRLTTNIKNSVNFFICNCKRKIRNSFIDWIANCSWLDVNIQPKTIVEDIDETAKEVIKKLNKKRHVYGYSEENPRATIAIKIKACFLFKAEDDEYGFSNYNQIKEMLDDLDISYWSDANDMEIEIQIGELLSKKSYILEKYSRYDWINWLIDGAHNAADLGFHFVSVKGG